RRATLMRKGPNVRAGNAYSAWPADSGVPTGAGCGRPRCANNDLSRKSLANPSLQGPWRKPPTPSDSHAIGRETISLWEEAASKQRTAEFLRGMLPASRLANGGASAGPATELEGSSSLDGFHSQGFRYCIGRHAVAAAP